MKKTIAVFLAVSLCVFSLFTTTSASADENSLTNVYDQEGEDESSEKLAESSALENSVPLNILYEEDTESSGENDQTGEALAKEDPMDLVSDNDSKEIPDEEPEPMFLSAVPTGAEKPETVSTVDSCADGFTINLFDYNVLDVWENNPQNRYPYYINAYSPLGFYGQGGAANEYGGSEIYTGTYEARQGIYQNHLGDDGYPVLYDGSSLSVLYDLNEIDECKTVYSDVNHLFQIDEHGCYYYNSDLNYAYYDPAQGDGGDFKVYDGTYMVGESNPTWPYEPFTDTLVPVGFFPFDDFDLEKDNIAPRSSLQYVNKEGYNHQFGLSLHGNFYLPQGGKIDGEDLVFRFSGDDDALVYIDGILVMDIGGLHRPTHGIINFGAGTVTVEAVVDTYDGEYNTSIGTEALLTDLLGENFFAHEDEEHTIDFFYLERGGVYSNIALETNIHQTGPFTSVGVEKQWADSKDNHSADSVTVKLLANGKETGKEVILNETNHWYDKFTALHMYDDNGELIEYTVQEIGYNGYTASYEKHDSTIEQVDAEKEIMNYVWVPVDQVEDGGIYAITSWDWRNNSGTYALKHKPNDSYGGLISEQIIITENEIEVDGTTYNHFIKDVPLDEMWTFETVKENGADGQWTVMNQGSYIALVGKQAYGWYGPYHQYWYSVNPSDGWDGNQGLNFNNRLVILDGGRFVTRQIWMNNGNWVWDDPQYLYMQEGTVPQAAPIFEWSGFYTMYKRVELKDKEAILIDKVTPVIWTITNTKVPEESSTPNPGPEPNVPRTGEKGTTPFVFVGCTAFLFLGIVSKKRRVS